MKRRIVFTAAKLIAFLLVCVFMLTACTKLPDPGNTGKITQAPKRDETPVPTEAVTVTPEPTEVITEVPEPTPIPGPTLEPLDVPYYSYDEMLLSKVTAFFKCYETDGYWECEASNSGGGSETEFLQNFPDAAKRERDERCYYYMLDTDNESRLFLFYDDHNNYRGFAGYPVLVQEPRPYEAFAALEIGDPIEAVVEVDPAVELTKRAMFENALLPGRFSLFEMFASYADKETIGFKRTVSTLHYLTDGVLRIDYNLNEAGDVVIEAMT